MQRPIIISKFLATFVVRKVVACGTNVIIASCLVTTIRWWLSTVIRRRRGATSMLKFIEFSNGNGRYYVNGKWVGNYYTDRNGNRHDATTGIIL